jgi:hypothetical protein
MDDEDPFESPRLLLAGAARHIDAFRLRVEDLRKSDWKDLSGGVDDQGVIMVKTNVEVPADMKQIVFDVTNNLRSALDHAVFASTLALTGEERNQTKFAFGDTPAELEGDSRRRCRDVPREISDFLLKFEAHREGNRDLWGLNKLRNTKSHRVLVPFGANVSMVGMGEPTAGTAVKYEWDPATGRFRAEMQRAEGVPVGAVIFAFRLEILIGTGAFRGEPALGVFERMSSEVERVVSAIDAETTRLLREQVA